MTAQGSEQVTEVVAMGTAAPDQAEVVRRANQLCRRAEPHSDVVPCTTHLHEAQRQLLGVTD